MLQPWRTGKVIRIENETPNTRRYWIEVPELPSFDFIPGQFVTLDLPIHEKPNKRWRSYSIASWPDGTNVFELVIVLVEDGLGTPYIFNHVKVGSELIYRGAQGVFTLPEPLDRDLYLVCTGTGIAPFRSMLHYMHLHQLPYQQIYLIFGTRVKGDILYFEELKELAGQMPKVHYIPTLSREKWDGATGYVHAVYEDLVQKQMQEATDGTRQPKPAYFFLCGWKNMIDEAKQRILALGYDKKSIHQELYG